MGCHPWWLKKALMRWSLSRLDRRVFTFCQLVIGPLREMQRKREVRTNYGFWWRRAEVRCGCFQSEFLKEIKHHHSGLFLTACLKSAPSDGNWMLRLRTSYPCEQNFKNVDVSFSCCDWDWTMETVLFVWQTYRERPTYQERWAFHQFHVEYTSWPGPEPTCTCLSNRTPCLGAVPYSGPAWPGLQVGGSL